MNTLQCTRSGPESGSPAKPVRRKRMASSVFRAVASVPRFGEPLSRTLTQFAARRRVKKGTGEFAALSGLSAFSGAAKAVMEKRERSGYLPRRDILVRSRLSAYYSKKLAAQCVKLGIEGADEGMENIVGNVAGSTKVGLYCVPQAITDYEKMWDGTMPENFRKIIRECYPDFSADFLDRFDDGTDDFKRARTMIRCQQVAYDGKGTYNSPSYPLYDEENRNVKGKDLPLEAQLIKLAETLSAVLFKQFAPDCSDAENQRHTETAAATMIAVSGKDVNPELTAVLLTVLFPPAPLAYTRMVVERLAHPDPEKLEQVNGEDIRYAKEVVLNSELFRILVDVKRHAAEETKEREQRQREEEMQAFVDGPTLQVRYDDLVDGSGGSADPWDEETVPDSEFPIGRRKRPMDHRTKRRSVGPVAGFGSNRSPVLGAKHQKAKNQKPLLYFPPHADQCTPKKK